MVNGVDKVVAMVTAAVCIIDIILVAIVVVAPPFFYMNIVCQNDIGLALGAKQIMIVQRNEHCETRKQRTISMLVLQFHILYGLFVNGHLKNETYIHHSFFRH